MCLRAAPVASSVLAAMRMARAAGVPVSIDLNLRLELWGLDEGVLAVVAEAVSLADVVLGNGPEELVPLARAAGFEVDAAEAAARALAGGERTIVGRLGAQGALACSAAGEAVVVPGFAADVCGTRSAPAMRSTAGSSRRGSPACRWRRRSAGATRWGAQGGPGRRCARSAVTRGGRGAAGQRG